MAFTTKEFGSKRKFGSLEEFLGVAESEKNISKGNNLKDDTAGLIVSCRKVPQNSLEVKFFELTKRVDKMSEELERMRVSEKLKTKVGSKSLW